MYPHPHDKHSKLAPRLEPLCFRGDCVPYRSAYESEMQKTMTRWGLGRPTWVLSQTFRTLNKLLALFQNNVIVRDDRHEKWVRKYPRNNMSSLTECAPGKVGPVKRIWRCIGRREMDCKSSTYLSCAAWQARDVGFGWRLTGEWSKAA